MLLMSICLHLPAAAAGRRCASITMDNGFSFYYVTWAKIWDGPSSVFLCFLKVKVKGEKKKKYVPDVHWEFVQLRKKCKNRMPLWNRKQACKPRSYASTILCPLTDWPLAPRLNQLLQTHPSSLKCNVTKGKTKFSTKSIVWNNLLDFVETKVPFFDQIQAKTIDKLYYNQNYPCP